MSHVTDENLRDLKAHYKEKSLFEPGLKSDTFLLICEILKNLKLKKRFRKCFSKLLVKKLKNHQKTFKILVSNKTKLKKKKKIFMSSKPNFQKWILAIIKQFFKKCLVLLRD